MYIRVSKKKKASNWSYYAILLSCLCVLVQLYAIPHGKTSLMSLSNRVLMVIWIVFMGIALLRRLEQSLPAQLAGAVVLVGTSVAAYLFAVIKTPSLVIDNGLKLLGFLILPVMFLYSAVFEIDTRAKTAILVFNLFVAMLFIYLYNSDKQYIFEDAFGVSSLDVITLGYPNPNQTAMYLFLCAVSLVAGVFYFKHLFVKVVFAAMACCMAWFLQQTGSRTAILLFVAFLILLWTTGKREVPGFWINIALFLPLVYVLLMPLTKSVTIMGESMFNGRGKIFDRYFNSLNVATVLFGDLNRFHFDNLHNGYVAIAASVGVPACAGYIHLIKNCLQANRPRHDAPVFERVAFIGFLCALMYTSAEAAFFVGGSTYAMLVFSVFVLFTKTRFSQPDESDAC